MIRGLEFRIGLRYTRARRKNNFISFISLTSMLGIALGVTALITVLSVMNGFEKELRERILGMAAHTSLLGLEDTLPRWREVAETAMENDQVLGAAPYIEGQGMLSSGDQAFGVMIRGIDPAEERNVSEVSEQMVEGELEALNQTRFGIVLGTELASRLGAGLGDKVTLMIPKGSVTPAGLVPRMKRFTVVGLFEVGMYEFDSGLALLSLRDSGKLFRMGDEVTGVRLRLSDMFKAPEVSREIANDSNRAFRVTDWTRQHANFFSAIQMEKRVMFIILMLIVAVAAFNIVSTMVMVVTDKESDIAILRTLGERPRDILAIFIVQGTVIGVVGTLLGVLGGISLALNVETLIPAIEQLFDTQFLSADIYYINAVPSDMRWSDVTMIAGVSLVLSLLATIYPAWKGSRVQPAESLRYE
ncbi:MAG: lipoprotein-releasing ABC transporter permease subunit [Gammaproteobacteria bacterium]|uniref:Lipoprotein-releasing ABC transporter permease subunit n=1 Tax=Candidatus Thiopontia autotrophica TaxID=2841688 RepID=A0A8J6TQ81_9GAMM|nr:lipoprotein-releasing ABC transporter permease subunit [Candidatus Thiopontia autotrophica]MBL6985053.1 lipoprotein-releasing ABC transporter permease subunit [Candidatus Thioglobus sp.]